MREEKMEDVQKLFALSTTREGLPRNRGGYSKEKKELEKKTSRHSLNAENEMMYCQQVEDKARMSMNKGCSLPAAPRIILYSHTATFTWEDCQMLTDRKNTLWVVSASSSMASFNCTALHTHL